MIYPSSNLPLMGGGIYSFFGLFYVLHTTFREELRLGTLNSYCVKGCTDSSLAQPPGSPHPQFSLPLPLALQGAWSPSQLVETSVQACHEFEDSWILE